MKYKDLFLTHVYKVGMGRGGARLTKPFDTNSLS